MIKVLRLNHRQARDKRVTTHCGLVSRAFGAGEFILSGEKDESVLKSLETTSKAWGGDFKVSYETKWRAFIKSEKERGSLIVHLSMYSEKLSDALPKIKARKKDLVLVVGSAKVPADLYHLADYNVAVGNQPHSEVAALAVFLHEYFQGKELEKEFKGGKISLKPSIKGKIISRN